ncbi:MAG: hypothetical protein HYU36_10935 [Planctomycetes bacterium]|nr:hypothetical protein [Planctomycetota bacterium]
MIAASLRSPLSPLAVLVLAAATFCPAHAGPLQNILGQSKAYAALPAKAYQPDFSIRPVDEPDYAKTHRWILDGQQKIGLLSLGGHELELFRFAPPPDGKVVEYRMPAVHHWATLQGPRITLNAPLWLPVATSQFVLVREKGPALEFRYEETLESGIRGGNHFLLRWDERLGYMVEGKSDYALPQPQEFEFNNMLAGGLSESRDDHKRWQKTLWPGPDGRILFQYHNPTHCYPRGMARPGFVGFVTEENINPFFEILEAAPEPTLATCSQWYDQHIIAKPPQEKEADGFYHVRASFRFLSVPGSVARELDEKAVPGMEMRADTGALGFLQGKVNDFESGIPSDRVYNGCMWHVAACTECAHSGKNSLKIAGGGAGKVNSAFPGYGGTAVYGETAKRYRCSAWVKTAGLQDGGAFIQVDDVFWNWNDVRASRKSEKLTGNHDWTRLEVEFQPCPGDPFLVIRLCAEGTGDAWFDDLELVEVAGAAAAAAP